MDHDDDGETSYNTFVDDVAFEPTYLQALLTVAGRNVATERQYKRNCVIVKGRWSVTSETVVDRSMRERAPSSRKTSARPP